MKKFTTFSSARRLSWVGALLLLAASPRPALGATPPPGDPGWPRVFRNGGVTLTVHQPQVDGWKDWQRIHFRCAIAVAGVLKDVRYGVAEIVATTVIDQARRIVVLTPIQREVRFAGVTPEERMRLLQAIQRLAPPEKPTTLSLDRVIAYLDETTQLTQKAVEVSLDPPRIFFSTSPAILVVFMGKPQYSPVAKDRKDLEFALNTNWDLLVDTASKRFYLLNGEGWLTTTDLGAGPWAPAAKLPPSLYALPADPNWAEARKRLPGKPARSAPAVFVSNEPAELIVTNGPPTFRPIPGTRLQQVTNTKSALLRDTTDGKFYFLVAGRWFRAGGPQGPWTAASRDLPADFARIPYEDPASVVKVSVPGTREAKDALLLASIPTTTTVDLSAKPVHVTYGGEPGFVPIEGTAVQVAWNSSPTVFRTGGSFYACDQGVWFCGASPNGPWTFCRSVPLAIYSIPPSSPYHNVTYVVVQSSTPTTVVYAQTSGYSGSYVAMTGVVMFGAGMAMGAAMATPYPYPYRYYPPPPYYSYGYGATYHYGYGGYTTAYGPYGSATRAAVYNPYTGARAAGGQVSTPYGSAGAVAGYNPTTGNAAAAGYRSNAYGSAAGVTTSQGGSAAAWDTTSGQGAVAKTGSGDVYATNGDTVYKKDASGGWSSNSGSGWQSASAAPASNSAATHSAQGMDSQAQSRQWGSQQSQRASQSGAADSSGSGSRSGGGRSGGGRR
ncbi:MAG: hypothetical protein WCS72_18230 [Deltaproteobacteria bacterium]